MMKCFLPVVLPAALSAALLLSACGSDDRDYRSWSEQADGGKADRVDPTAKTAAECPNPTARKEYSEQEIKAAIQKHIAQRTALGEPGVFELTDPRTSQTLQLQFVTVHDPVASLGGGRYFACTDFHADGDPDKIYDLDFWLMEFEGELVVYEENVHKLPVRDGREWVKQERYNFVDNEINLLR